MKKNFIVSLSFIFTMFLFSSQSAHADFMNPEFLTKKCKAGETEVICTFKSTEPFGPRTTDECSVYASDRNYYLLTGHGSSFGGEDKYCKKSTEQKTVGAQDAPLDKNLLIIVGASVFALIISALSFLLLLKKNAL